MSPDVDNQWQWTFKLNNLEDLFLDDFVLKNHGFSQNYQADLQIRSNQALELAELLQQPAQLNIINQHGSNNWHGIITQAQGTGITPDREQYQYSLHFQSPLSLMQYNKNHRIFLNCTIIDVISQLLSSNKINYKFRLSQSYPEQESITQTGETEYDFLLYLLSHWGLFFTFVQDQESYQLLITDNVSQLDDNNIALRYQELTGMHRPEPTVFKIRTACQTLAKNIRCNDYNQRYRITLETDCLHLQPGQIISLTDCPISSWNRNFRIISLSHEGSQNTKNIYYHESKTFTYRNSALCLPAEAPYHTPQSTNIKRQGLSSARIESLDESVYLDEHSHYRVRFSFDRNSTTTGEASQPVRLMQTYSGMNSGFHSPLYPDTEVLYTYEMGNPDRPILMGTLSNPNTPSPITANNPTQNLWCSWRGNTLLMDDNKNHPGISLATPEQKNILSLIATPTEQKIRLATNQGTIVIQALKTFHTKTFSNYHQTIGNDQQITVINQQKIITKNGDIQLQAAGDIKLKAKQDIQLSTQQGGINFQSQQRIIFSANQDMQWQAKDNLQITTTGGKLFMQAKQNINFTAPIINISQSGAKIQIQADGTLYIQGNSITIIAQ